MAVAELVDSRLELAKGLVVVVLETVPVVLVLVLVRVPGKAEAIERSLEACCRLSPSGDLAIFSVAYIATHVPRFRNCPLPGLPLNSPLSITTLPRDRTVSTTPLIFLRSWAL